MMKKTHMRKSEALAKLKVPQSSIDVMPAITPQVEALRKRLIQHEPEGAELQGPYYYLHCSDTAEARAILDKYYSISKTARGCLPIEAFCAAAKVPTLKCLEIIYGTAARIAQQHVVVASAMASSAQPEITEKMIEYAKTPEGFDWAQLLSKATGFLPQPRGPSVRVNVNQSQSATAASVSAAPPPENAIRRMVDRFNEHRVLTQAATPLLEDSNEEE